MIAIRSPRILVVDDDAAILRLVTAVLRRARYNVDNATDGRDALAKIAQTPYDVVVLDLMMPQISGFELLSQLPAGVRSSYVIVMSAASDAVISKIAGGNVFATLRKPFDIEDMLAAVRACVDAGTMLLTG